MNVPFPVGRSTALGCAGVILLSLCFGCGGGTGRSSISTPPPPVNPITPAPKGGIQPSFFGFQCGTGQNSCPGESWPSSVAQPGTLRLWDSGTFWNDIEGSVGQYNFSTLDGWLDTIAAQNKASVWAVPINVIYTFGFVACAEASNTANQTPKGCIYPPSDLPSWSGGGSVPSSAPCGQQGSCAFNNFVTHLVQHCSPAGNCVKDLIKNYEMWNEPNNAVFWWENTPGGQGEMQIYQMAYGAVPIIRQNVANATIMTMASTVDAQYTQAWLQLENSNPPASGGTLSDVVVWHQYLNVSTSEVAPDDPSNIARLNGMLTAMANVPGWGSKPWEITETGFQAYTPPYNCTAFSTADCIGQMVRWQIIVLSGNASGMDWYSWNANIGQQPAYAEAWSFMMKNILGGTFTTPCSGSGTTWTCGFKETSGKTAQWVWSTNSSGSYTVPSGYTNSVSFNVNSQTPASTSVSSGQAINISTMPMLLEQ